MILPSLLLSQGAPTLPLTDTPARAFLRELGARLPRPKAILVISARPKTIRVKSICYRFMRHGVRRASTRAPSGCTPVQPMACCGWTSMRSERKTTLRRVRS